MNRFERVREICCGWGLYEEGNSTEQMQILKAISEVGELADSIANNDREQAKDDIGDILVCLINACHIGGFQDIERYATFNHSDGDTILLLARILKELSDGLKGYISYCLISDYIFSIAKRLELTIDECLGQAISEIEKRKGKIINGVFVKDSEQ